MTNAEVHSINPKQPPVVSIKDRLAQVADTAFRLHVDAQQLPTDTGKLLYELQAFAENPAIPDDIHDALDAAYWLPRAIENVEGEFDALVSCLDDVIEALNSDEA